MTDEMKPVRCGCGGEAVVGYTESGLCYVECQKCETETRIFRTEAEAIKVWNRAMGEDKVDELMEHVWREKLDTREKIAELVERMLK